MCSTIFSFSPSPHLLTWLLYSVCWSGEEIITFFRVWLPKSLMTFPHDWHDWLFPLCNIDFSTLQDITLFWFSFSHTLLFYSSVFFAGCYSSFYLLIKIWDIFGMFWIFLFSIHYNVYMAVYFLSTYNVFIYNAFLYTYLLIYMIMYQSLKCSWKRNM